MDRALQIGLALVLDRALPEPPEAVHPVCLMGRAIAAAERAASQAQGDPRRQRAAGTMMALALPAAVFLTVRALLHSLPRRLQPLMGALMISWALAGRSLAEAATAVESGLATGLEDGRRRASRMVGRDTDGLDEDGVRRAALESVAENTNDGVVAPLFYGFVGGAPLALAYRMVNTLDSMVGYRDERYEHLGRASARLDDAAGYVPARLAALGVVAAAALGAGSHAGAWEIWRRDAAAHASPNAGVIEAAFAGALGVGLGGPSSYRGFVRPAAEMGRGLKTPAEGDIGRAVRLMANATVAAAAIMATLGWIGRALSKRAAGLA